MDDDAGRSSKSPALKQAQTELKEAQTKLEDLEAAQNKLEEAQTELKEAQTELKEAQTKWLSAEKDKHIHENIVQSHENIVQSAKEKVQSAKEMCDFWLDAAKKMQGAPAQSSEGFLAKKLDELMYELKERQGELMYELKERQDELRERLGQVAKNEALLMEAFLNRYTLTPVSHYSSATLDGEWHQRACEYYNTRSCLVLQKLFPEDFQATPRWLATMHWDSIFPAVAEHIIPKNGYSFVQNELGIQIDSPRNSILLLRHLEHTFQDGDWSLIPVETRGGAVNFKIHVSQDLKEMNVNYIDKNGHFAEPVLVRKAKGQALKPLKFWDLHGRDLWVQPPPFLRALYLKARMAWQKHKNDDHPLPDPTQFADTFSDLCGTWNDFMVGKFLSSIRQLNSAGGTQSPWFWKIKRLFHRGGWRKMAFEDLSNFETRQLLLHNF